MKLTALAVAAALAPAALSASAQVAVRAELVHTVSGAVITDGVVIVSGGRIAAVGPAASTPIPAGHEVLEAAVVTPGLVDARTVAGLSGIYNGDDQTHDQDMLERSSPIQPGLRAIDAYNPREPLVEYVRSFGVTTIHVGHAPGELVSGQTMIAKTRGTTVAEAVVKPFFGLAATLSPAAKKGGATSPGTRGKMMAMLREALIAAREYASEHAAHDGEGAPPARDLGKEALAAALAREVPFIVTANRAQDIAGALRLAAEFDLRLWLDMGAEAYTLIDDLRAAGVPVLLHPTMYRAWGDTKNLSFTTAARLADAGIAIAIQTGFESYVPKVRVLLFEAAIAAAHGLGPARALEAITLSPARMLGIADRVGSLEVGKDGDLALFDGDPFEYTTHCIGVVIEGEVVSRQRR
ncbi:MAG: amidohydrolase [Planctomycetes bacterium]|jgi:imidazolonepropionase-like amidohydrolase|nr:amidohydrolase [Planctomycetota bacterium]MDP6410849.1 amidohydrolase family protein [Planctomycetota bacterium]